MSDVQRRLLDLLAGWEAHVLSCAKDAESHPGVTREQYLAEAEQIGLVYQAVGSVEGPRADMIAMSYLSTHITDILMRGATRGTEVT